MKFFRFRLLSASLFADAAAVSLLLVLTAVAAWDLLLPGVTFVGADAATQFYPWYAFLGESLRSGDVPGWNPHQFSGTPFAADPLSGWAYLPAMTLFTALPPLAAAKVYGLFHLLLAGCATYGLARVLGLGTAGALLAAVSYEFSGFLYVENSCCFAYAGVMAWLPLAFLGAEGAILSASRLNMVLWWGLSGLALSQILAAWLGQGSYYALLALLGYVAYRTLLSPPEYARGLRARLLGPVLHGAGILLFGFGLAASGLLPRLEYNALSNLAGGYPGSGGAGGWTVEDWRLLLEPGLFYAGGAVLALALVSPLIARGRFATPYFATLCLAALVLSGTSPTLLHSTLNLLPRFGQLHPHFPERVMIVFFLGAALLAGATLSRLGELGKNAGTLLALPALATLLLAARFQPAAPLLLALVSLLVAAYALLPGRSVAWRGLAAGALALVVFSDLFAAGRETLVDQGEAVGGSRLADRVREIDLAEYYRPTGVARFLQPKADEEPSRYLGYGPRTGIRRALSSPVRFADPETQALGVNNRAMTLALQGVQGYNAVRLARYDEYMKALNGEGQDYHYSDVFEGGLDSPLLDLLNVRHVIVPARTPLDGDEGVQKLKDSHRTVYVDDDLEVLENRGALPRAWIVHSARRARPAEALDLLASGAVDPRQTALLEETPPELSRPVDDTVDRARITEHGADRVRLETVTSAQGLLVMSEAYYPAWQAYVDGRPVRLYRADHLLRAVPVPAGEHAVELRYESATLRAGISISLVTGGSLVAVVIAVLIRRGRKSGARSSPTRYSMTKSSVPRASVEGEAP